jgi:hypothetical protein
MILLVATLLAVPCGAQGAEVYGIRPDGQRVTTLADRNAKAVVLYFVASDCPISNRTFPEMKRVQAEFQGRGVRFWFVYPNSTEQASVVKDHQASFDSGGEAVLDAGGALVKLTGAVVTPEVSVLVPQAGGWKAVYTGRIDDRYVRIGLERPRATEHFAERVVGEVLAGERVEAATGTPVGCGIVSLK